MSETEKIDDVKVTLSYKPLFELLQAVVSGGPALREILALSGSTVEDLTGDKTCLTKVLDEFQAEVSRLSGQAQEVEPATSNVIELGSSTIRNYEYKLDVSGEPPNTIVFDHKKLAPHHNVVGTINYNEDICVNAIELELLTKQGRKIQFTARLSGDEVGKVFLVGVDQEKQGPHFDKTFKFRDKYFLLSAFLGFQPSAGVFSAEFANIVHTSHLFKLSEMFGTDDEISSISVVALYVHGTFTVT